MPFGFDARRLFSGVIMVAGLGVLGGALGASPRPQTQQPSHPSTTAPQTPAPGQTRPSGDGRRGFGPGYPGTGPTDRSPWWKDAAIIKEIGLAPQQIDKIDRIYTQRNKQIDPYLQEFRKQQDELDRMIRERTAQPTEIELQASKMLAQKTKLDESRIVMIYRMNLVLSADQLTKLQAVFERMDRERGNHDRGRRNPAPQ